MIEKKIRYDINIEKPSKTKPVTQGGVLNYLGKQKTVTAPRRWRSSPEHPIAHLAYITKDEEKILIDLNLYGSLKGKPNKGPSGIMSLQGSGGGAGGGDGGGDGGSSGGDGGQGDSGPGGSDDGSSSGVGSGEGESTGDANDQGGTEGPGGMGMGAEGGFGIGPGDDGPGMGVSDTFGSDTAPGVGLGVSDTFGQDVAEDTTVADVDMSMPAMQTVAEKAQAIAMSQMTPAAMAGRALGMMTGIPGMGIVGGIIGSNIGRGVTGPSDDTQEQSSVQSGPAQSVSDGGGGITTIPTYAPLTNVSTGDNTADAIRTRLENLLKVPTTQTVFTNQNVNPLSNYSLLDLYNLRR
jgi:hypothetical protein